MSDDKNQTATATAKAQEGSADKPVVKAAPKPQPAAAVKAQPVASVKPAATAKAKPATVKKAANKKPVAAKTVKKNSVKKQTVKVAAKKAAPAPKTSKKKETTMTNFDMNSWFGGYDLPNSDKVEELMANAGKQGEELIAKSRATTEELAEITKANVEAVIESSRIAANGAKDIGTKIIEDSRTQFETVSDNMRLLAEAKSPQDFMAMQAELAKSSFDRMISESSKLTEHMVKLAGDAMQPVQNRASVNAEKVKDLMA